MKDIVSFFEQPRIREFARFCLVGAFCTAIDAGVFYSIHNWTGYRIALICGFCLSVIVNYILNIYWSFQAKPSTKNAIGFLGAHCFNLFVVRISLMWLFVEAFEFIDSIAFIPTLLISVLANFLIVRFVIRK